MADLKESSLFKALSDQQNHWYYRHKVGVIRNFLKRNLPFIKRSEYFEVTNDSPLKCLDIGAGNGIISRTLGTRLSGENLSWDLVDTAYTKQELDSGEGDPSFALYNSIPKESKYNIIVAIDVVEHVEDDNEFINLLVAQLAPEGIIIICVPAFQFLWSSHDIFLEHYRRYHARDIVTLMRVNGLSILEWGYLYVILFPLIATARVLSRLRLLTKAGGTPAYKSSLKVYPKIVNRALTLCMKFEQYLLQTVPSLGHFAGSSCIVIGKKN